MTSDEEAERLRLRMQRIRRRLDTDMEDLLSDAQQLFDWRYYLLRHPITCAFGAAAVGFLIVPRKRAPAVNKVYLDPETSREWVKDSEKVVVEAVEPAPAQGVLLSLGTLALNMAVRNGMNYATQWVRDALTGPFQQSARTQSPRTQGGLHDSYQERP